MGRKSMKKKYEECAQIIQEKIDSLDKIPEPIFMQFEQLLQNKPKIIESTEIRYDQLIIDKIIHYTKNQVLDRVPIDIVFQYGMITGFIQKALSKIK